jgi:hypothetical protein
MQNIHFTSILQLIFLKVNLPALDGSITVGHLLVWVRDNLVKERPELLLKDPSAGPKTIDVRPGILVLVGLVFNVI